jgi:hypothetical protein
MQRNDNSGEQSKIIVTVTEGILMPKAEVPEGYTLKGGLFIPTAKTGIILSEPVLPKDIAGVILSDGEVKIEEPKKPTIIIPTAAEVKKLKLS